MFRRISGQPGAFWLDDGDESPAYLGFSPTARLSTARDGSVKIADGAAVRQWTGDPLAAVEAFVAAAGGAPNACSAPRFVGFFAYDLAPLIEPAMGRLRADPTGLPIVWLARHDAVLAVRREPGGRSARLAIEAIDERAADRLADAVAALAPTRSPLAAATPSCESATVLETPDRRRYVAAVERAQDYIAAGDVYQVNLAERFRVACDLDPEEAYLRMRAAQAVPCGSFLRGDGFAVLSRSPETFLRVRGSAIETEPIKGTRPRAPDPVVDEALREDLVRDPKERAEHVMIVDLERNDLGRICAPGSIAVPSLLRTESFATLHHLVSTVRGRLRDDVGLADVLRATFPGGSITGAPKIRAAQIIAELEPVARGVYTGATVALRGARDLDSAIAIRTAVWRDGVFAYHVGAGIVADSDPEREHAECWLKARPFLQAVGVAPALGVDRDADGEAAAAAGSRAGG
ncbi:MAG TPA: aminodeoxychorismate synthase component I [Candidatus Binatia bacterium]|nr:aminodeoxychorismate synthase component I [Candidatus Binatia bacterium]